MPDSGRSAGMDDVTPLPQRAPRERKRKVRDDKSTSETENPVLQFKPSSSLRPKEKKYEYLDHTADVQIHSWGYDVREAFEQAGYAMFDYMSDLETVNINPDVVKSFEVEGHDMHSLLFAFMDELLYTFASDYFLSGYIEVESFDKESWTIRARCKGEVFEYGRHPQGTEVKAITYSNMQVIETEGKCEVYIIIDI